MAWFLRLLVSVSGKLAESSVRMTCEIGRNIDFSTVSTGL